MQESLNSVKPEWVQLEIPFPSPINSSKDEMIQSMTKAIERLKERLGQSELEKLKYQNKTDSSYLKSNV